MQNSGVIADSYLKPLIMDEYSDPNVSADYDFNRWQREGYVWQPGAQSCRLTKFQQLMRNFEWAMTDVLRSIDTCTRSSHPVDHELGCLVEAVLMF